MRLKFFVVILVLTVIVAGVLFFKNRQEEPAFDPSPTVETPVKIASSPAVVKEVYEPKSVFNQVPFTSQAPTNEWSDPRQQDACEEAAVLMAIKWIRGETFPSKEEARNELLAISQFQTEKYGEFTDTSSQDTIDRIFKEYYQFDNVELKSVNSADDIVLELNRGNLVITPMNGQALNNSHYTSPGPERHMILITGYDLETDEFITNDAGTTVGKDFRYGTELFVNAIRDYPTGDHEPILDPKKNMMVVSKGE